MSRKNYSIDEVIQSLNRKHDCRVHKSAKRIEILIGSQVTNDLGNGSWGKLDFLQKQDFVIVNVNKFS